jgi:hypothetical protein
MVKRKSSSVTKKFKIGDAAIAAWRRCDFIGLHRSLNLAPFERSPFPVELTYRAAASL